MRRNNYKKIFWALFALGVTYTSFTAAGDTPQARAAQQLKEYEARLLKGQEEAMTLLAQARERAEKVQAELTERARQEASAIVARARDDIERERGEAVAQVREQVVRLSAQVAARLLERSVTDGDHRRFVQETLDRLGAHP